MLDQELNVSTVYWEGASRFSGTLGNEPVSATGYVEMTGYAHSMSRRL
jgi:predicted secreted hydrolase